MKTGLEKWNEELKKKNDIVREAWIESPKEVLDGWLQDIDMVICFAETVPSYVPTIKHQWKEPTKPTDSKTAMKHTARKSAAGWTKSANKSASLGKDPEKR